MRSGRRASWPKPEEVSTAVRHVSYELAGGPGGSPPVPVSALSRHILPREQLEHILRFLEEETLQEMLGERELPFCGRLLCSQTLCCVLHGLSFWIFTKIHHGADGRILIILMRKLRPQRLCNVGCITNE